MSDQPGTVGERVRMLREVRGWSQRELARQAKLSYPIVQGLEAGTRNRLSVESLDKLAEALGVSLDYLVRGGELPPQIIVDPHDPEIEAAFAYWHFYDLKPSEQANLRERLRRGLEKRRRADGRRGHHGDNNSEQAT